MVSKYYEIIEEDNDKPYAYYCLKIRWNVLNIINNDINNNGYIVQKVNIINTTGLKGLPEEGYYEAWKVINGKIDNPKNYNYDDNFIFYDKMFINECRNISRGITGEITYLCEVFWINSNNMLYDEINLWKNDVLYAGDLKSIYESNFKYKFKNAIIYRQFSHKVKY